MSTAKKAIIACAVILIAGGVGFFILQREHTTALFFSSALSSAGVSVPANASLGSLELLYAQTVAERSPLFGIVGTDPSALASAVSALATTTQNIAAAQPNSQDAKLAQELYPIDFLRSLAVTEAAREAFVADGSSANERAYDAALHATASAGITDAEAFDSGLETEVGTTTFTLIVPNYPITSSLMLESASDTVAQMKDWSAELDARDACLSGNTSSCDTNDIVLPQVAAAAPPLSSASLPQLPADVLSLFSSALPAEFFSDSKLVRFDSSICLSAFPSPYYVSIQTGNDDPRQRYLYINDIIFTKVLPDLTQNTFLQAYGIAYLFNDPFEFYQCPEVEADMSDISAVANTAQFAQQHPELAPQDAQALEGQVADEGYARNYISDALSQATSSAADQSALISLALEFNEGNAALATVVGEVAVLDQFNLQAASDGSLQGGNILSQLFFTHSAFPSLFLVSSRPAAVVLREKSATSSASDLSIYALYSALRGQVPESKFVHDLRGEFDFESGIPPQ